MNILCFFRKTNNKESKEKKRKRKRKNTILPLYFCKTKKILRFQYY